MSVQEEIEKYLPLIHAFVGKYQRRGALRRVEYDDLVSECMTEVWRILSLDKAHDNLDSYIKTRIRGRILDTLRSSAWFYNRGDNLREYSVFSSDFGQNDEEIVDQRLTTGQLDLHEPILMQVVNQLPPSWREVIIDHYIHDLDISEIARRRNVSEPRISQVRSKALARMKKLLEEMGVNEWQF